MTTHADGCRHGVEGWCYRCRDQQIEDEERRVRVRAQLDSAVQVMSNLFVSARHEGECRSWCAHDYVKLAERIASSYPDLTPRVIYQTWLARTH